MRLPLTQLKRTPQVAFSPTAEPNSFHRIDETQDALMEKEGAEHQILEYHANLVERHLKFHATLLVLEVANQGEQPDVEEAIFKLARGPQRGWCDPKATLLPTVLRSFLVSTIPPIAVVGLELDDP